MKKQFLIVLLALAVAGCSVNAQTKAPAGAKSNYQLAADYSADARGLSVLVMKGDKLVFEEYQNGHSANAPHMLASGTKSFSGVLLAAAIEDKLIGGFDEKVSDTIGEWKSDPRKAKITLRQLLTLTGGVETGPNGRPPAYSAAVGYASSYEPGEKFQYGPVPFQVFGEVLRRKLAARNESVMDYLKRRILDPVGLKAARWTMQEGQPNLPSGAFLTAREWAKFGVFMKNGGKWNGKQVVKKSLLDELTVGSRANANYGLTFWLNRSHTGQGEIAQGDSLRRRSGGDDDEGGVFRISRSGIDAALPKDLYMAAGAGNQRLYIIPSKDLVVVRQGRIARFDDREFLNLLLTGRPIAE